MITTVSKSTAATIASSLDWMQNQRDALEASMSRYMARSGPYDPSKGRHQVTTAALFDMLFDHAGRISAAGEIAGNPRHALRHHELAIDSEHYSSFGDGLGVVMKDVLGAEASSSLLAAWGDAYRAIVRMVAAQPVSMAA